MLSIIPTGSPIVVAVLLIIDSHKEATLHVGQIRTSNLQGKKALHKGLLSFSGRHIGITLIIIDALLTFYHEETTHQVGLIEACNLHRMIECCKILNPLIVMDLFTVLKIITASA